MYFLDQENGLVTGVPGQHATEPPQVDDRNARSHPRNLLSARTRCLTTPMRKLITRGTFAEAIKVLVEDCLHIWNNLVHSGTLVDGGQNIINLVPGRDHPNIPTTHTPHVPFIRKAGNGSGALPVLLKVTINFVPCWCLGLLMTESSDGVHTVERPNDC